MTSEDRPGEVHHQAITEEYPSVVDELAVAIRFAGTKYANWPSV